MKAKIRFNWKILLLGGLAFSINSCSKENSSEMENTEVGILIKESQIHGKVMTDSKGRSLYFFSNDSKGQSSCSGSCLNDWPVFYDADAVKSKEIDKEGIDEITRTDGIKQTTYKGWPLYYFRGDSEKSDISGDGVNNVWYVAKPDYLLMVSNAQLIGQDGKIYRSDYSEGEGKSIYFTDGKGRTLYAFKPDKFNLNTYTKSDFSNDAIWPIFQTTVGSLPSIVRQSDISTTEVFGRKQLTYKGWPLYYYGGDDNRGDNSGISFPRPGIWPVVNDNTTTAPNP